MDVLPWFLPCAAIVYLAWRKLRKGVLPSGGAKEDGPGRAVADGKTTAPAGAAGSGQDPGALVMDEVAALLDRGRYRAALSRIEKTLAGSPREDHAPLLYSVSICFDGLMAGKTPDAVVRAFDKMTGESAAFRAAIDEYGLEDFCDALAAAFTDPPDDVSGRTLRKALEFFHDPHPLILKTTLLHGDLAANYLNSLAQRVFADWDEEETPLPGVIKKLEARLSQ